MSVLRAGRGRGVGRGGGWKFLVTEKNSQNLGGGDFGVFGTPHAPTGRAGSEKDTLLPMTMTRLKFWNGPA